MPTRRAAARPHPDRQRPRRSDRDAGRLAPARAAGGAASLARIPQRVRAGPRVDARHARGARRHPARARDRRTQVVVRRHPGQAAPPRSPRPGPHESGSGRGGDRGEGGRAVRPRAPGAHRGGAPPVPRDPRARARRPPDPRVLRHHARRGAGARRASLSAALGARRHPGGGGPPARHGRGPRGARVHHARDRGDQATAQRARPGRVRGAARVGSAHRGTRRSVDRWPVRGPRQRPSAGGRARLHRPRRLPCRAASAERSPAAAHVRRRRRRIRGGVARPARRRAVRGRRRSVTRGRPRARRRRRAGPRRGGCRRAARRRSGNRLSARPRPGPRRRRRGSPSC